METRKHIASEKNVSDTTNYNNREDAIQLVKKKTTKEIMADSVVSLAFREFELGKPLQPALKKAQNNKHIWNVNRKGNVTKGRTSILLLDSNTPLSTGITIETYNDTVYYIELKSDSNRAFSNIADVYYG